VAGEWLEELKIKTPKLKIKTPKLKIKTPKLSQGSSRTKNNLLGLHQENWIWLENITNNHFI
jgi:hypothetical protein